MSKRMFTAADSVKAGRSRHERGRQEVAMRALKIVEQMSSRRVPQCEYARAISDELGTSRAQSYRLARMATDVLCVVPLNDAERRDARWMVPR